MRCFFFGLLSDKDVLEVVIDRPAPGLHVPGVVVEGLSETDMKRILFFESVEYEPRPMAVQVSDRLIEAQGFATTAHVVADDESWTFEDWRVRHKAHDLREAALWMSLYGRFDVSDADRLWDEAAALGRPLEDLIEEVCGVPRRAASTGL